MKVTRARKRRRTLLLGALSRPPLSRLSPSGTLALSPSFLSPSFLSVPRRLSLLLSPNPPFSPDTDPEPVPEPVVVFFALLVPFVLVVVRPLLFLSGDGGAESLDPVGRTARTAKRKGVKKNKKKIRMRGR